MRSALRVVHTLLIAGLGTAPAAAAEDPMPLDVMTFNIEYGGAHVSFDQVVAAIRDADPDIVGVQEAMGNLVRLAGNFGWYFDRRNYVISRFPVLDPPGGDGRYVFVEVRPGEVVVVANVHLPSDPYGPDLVRDGATPEAVLANEQRLRMPALRPYLEDLPALIQQGFPVFVTGDFNSPAHTDWTPATRGLRPFLRYPLEWPVSKAVADAGFRDSWRVLYPDPVSHPGLTWWAARPPLEMYAPGDNDARDRIDYIWYAGRVDVLGAALLGKRGEAEVTIGLDPWPSDHRALVSRFSVVPSPMPDLVTTRRRIYGLADNVEVIYRSQAEASIAIGRADRRTLTGNGSYRIPAASLGVGRHVVSLSMPGRKPSLERVFWVQADDAEPEVEVQGNVFGTGDGIDVRWANGPGNRNDYLVIDHPEAVAGYETGLAWAYVDALPEGRLTLDANSVASGWPVPAGRYVVRLLKDDGDEVLAESLPFTIRAAGGRPRQ